MSSGASKACNERRLLTKVQHTISPDMISWSLSPSSSYSRKDAMQPVVVPFCQARASVSLAFDKSAHGAISGVLEVSIRDVNAPSMNLQLEATVEWYTRPGINSTNELKDMDRSHWPPPEAPVKVILDGEGPIGTFSIKVLRALTVHLEVYAVPIDSVLRQLNSLHLEKKALRDVEVKEGGEEIPARRDLNLNALRLEKTLTDVELKVDGKKFPAHRAVLAANSPAFRSMFTSDLKEAREGVVEIEGASPTAFGLFLEFIYTANLDDWMGCELELLELADRYLVDHLKAACERRLQDIDWSTALGILEQANTKPAISSDLRRRAMQVVVENWETVSKTQQWTDFQASEPNLADAVRVSRKFFLSVAKK